MGYSFNKFDSIVNNDNVLIWRYLEPYKLEHLIETSSLYLRRADLLEDKFEGTIRERDREYIDAWILSGYNSRIKLGENINFSEYEKTNLGWHNLRIPEFFVTCFHINNFESLEMWSKYGNKGTGVAIATTVGKLKKLLHVGKNSIGTPRIGSVFYGDNYPKELQGMHSRIFSKNAEYQDECEFRICLNRPQFYFPGFHEYQKSESLKGEKDVNRISEKFYEAKYPESLNLPIQNISNFFSNIIIGQAASVETERSIKILKSKFKITAPVVRSSYP